MKREQIKNLSNLAKNMRRINQWFHFTRNRRYHTLFYYNWLKIYVGYENWKYLPQEFREQWDSASESFDRLYGLVQAWQNSTNSYLIRTETKAQEMERRDALAKAESYLEQYQARLEELKAISKLLDRNINDASLREEVKAHVSEHENELKDLIATYTCAAKRLNNGTYLTVVTELVEVISALNALKTSDEDASKKTAEE